MDSVAYVVGDFQTINCHDLRGHTKGRFNLGRPCSCTIFWASVTDH